MPFISKDPRDESMSDDGWPARQSWCIYSSPERPGDCEHAVGLPGESRKVDHDGATTENVYGKPNGWCWYCWKSYQVDYWSARALDKLPLDDRIDPMRVIQNLQKRIEELEAR